MTGSRGGRIGIALVTLVALASAGATAVRADEPPDTLGATVTASVYVDVSRELTVVNRSTVAVIVTVEPSGGWTVEPAEPQSVAVGGSMTVRITGDGEDAASIDIRLRPSATAAVGSESAEIVLGARVYREFRAPPGAPPWALPAVLVMLAVVLFGLLVARRLHAPRLRHRLVHP